MSDTQNPESQTRLSVIMFSDIVGYSKMMQENEKLAMTLLSRHNQIVRDALKKHDGKEIKIIGDAFLVSFATVTNAVQCAIEIQEGFSKYNETAAENEKTQVRIGLHMGDVIVKDNDIFGDGVNIASRIEPLAEPGGICISQEVYSLVKHKLDLQVVSLGPKELKNIKDKIEIYEILVGSIALKTHRLKRRRKNRKSWIYALAAVIVVTVCIITSIISFNKTSEPIVSRRLKAGGNNVNFPNISADGNWIVYVADDANHIHHLYTIHSSGGDPRMITRDTTDVWVETPCFSPDASQIVYARWEIWGVSDQGLFVVSTLGGSSRKLVNNAKLPMWSPDGKSIAFFRSDKRSFDLFVVNSDGTGEIKLTTINPIDFNHVDWSPDSRKLAFLRGFETPEKERYTEIYTRELEDSTEHQITFDKKVIDDFCWTSTGKIIYSLTKGSDVDLWMIPEEGGAAKQLTLGSGANRIPRISRDAKRLVYLNESQTSNLWSLNLETKQLQQLTFEDLTIDNPRYSYDGSKLIYRQSDPVGMSLEHFYGEGDLRGKVIMICNQDGSEATKLAPPVFGSYSFWQSLWTADGRTLIGNATRSDTVSRNPDSVVVSFSFFEYEIGANNPKKIGEGQLYDISRDGRFVLYRHEDYWKIIQGDYGRSVLALKTSPDKSIKEISSPWRIPWFTRDSKSIVAEDSTGVWLVPVEGGSGKRLVRLPEYFTLFDISSEGTTLLGTLYDPLQKKLTFVKFSSSNGKVENIMDLPLKSPFLDGTLSPDGSRIIFSKEETKNRIMVLDNFR